MSVLTQGEWELDGFTFGADSPVLIETGGLSYGASSTRSQDVSYPTADGGFFGRDWVDAPAFAFKFLARQGAPLATFLAALTAWRDPASRTTPGAVQTLRWRENGVNYRVYGRPRDFALTPLAIGSAEAVRAQASFQLADPFVYTEDSNGDPASCVVTLIALPGTGGVVWPAAWPWTWRPTGQAVNGNTTVTGGSATPFTVTVAGPNTGQLSGIKLTGTGWSIATTQTVAAGDSIVFDTRAMTATHWHGSIATNIAGTLAYGSSLAARLPVGAEVLGFEGSDPSNTATATFQWLPATPL